MPNTCAQCNLTHPLNLLQSHQANSFYQTQKGLCPKKRSANSPRFSPLVPPVLFMLIKPHQTCKQKSHTFYTNVCVNLNPHMPYYIYPNPFHHHHHILYMANPNPNPNVPQTDQPPSNPSIQVPDPSSSTVLPILDDQSPHSTSSNPSPRPIRSPGGSSSGRGRHPSYRGIRSRSGKWVSEIREPRKTTRIWLGTYPTPEMAAAAYDVAALALKGPDTPLNFPESILSYPIVASTSPSDIRAAAASAAAARLPKPESGLNPDVIRLETEGSSSSATRMESGQEFIDEEALLNMPNLLVDMAEGMLVSPPRINSPSSDDSPGNSDAESLWSYQ